MLSSSRVELPNQRGCITRYLVLDVSTQSNVIIFMGRTAQAEGMPHKIFGSRGFDKTYYSHLQESNCPRREDASQIFGVQRFDTTECSHLQRSNCPSREDASQDIWFPTFRHNLLFSSSRVELPKKRRCNTRYFVADVSKQRNVLIFEACHIQKDYFLEMKTWPTDCLKTARTKYPAAQRYILHPHRSETLKTCKFYEIPPYFTPKNTGYMTKNSREINLRFWPGMKPVHKLALWAKCKQTGLSETNGSPRLRHTQCYFSARRRGVTARGGAECSHQNANHHASANDGSHSRVFPVHLTKLSEFLDWIYSYAMMSLPWFLQSTVTFAKVRHLGICLSQM